MSGGGVPIPGCGQRRGVRWWRGAAALLFGATAVLSALPARAAVVPRSVLGVRFTGVVYQFPEATTGVGYAGSHRLWVFESPRAILPADAVVEMDTAKHRFVTGARFRPTFAFGTAPDGAAFAAFGDVIERWWQGKATVYRLGPGVFPLRLSAVSAGAVWLAFRTGPSRRVEAALLRLPADVMMYAHHLAGLANESVVAMAAAPGGVWVTTGPRPVLYWVPATGGPSVYTRLYARSMVPKGGRMLGGVAVDAGGFGYVSGYLGSGATAVWPIGPGGRVGSAVALPEVVNMVSTGLVVDKGGDGFVGFSAIGGDHGLPGVAEVTPGGLTAASVVGVLSVPGGGMGGLTLTPGGHLWATVPFSHDVVELQPAP